MKQRIQKVLASYGVESRRHIEQMVLDGRITVNGEVVTSLPVMVDPLVDHVKIDDKLVKLRGAGSGEAPVYLMMNKPRDVVCTNVAQGEQTRAIDLLGREFRQRVFPVGRLDADSKGLLLLTNDGELANKLTHPRYEVAKTYTAIVDGDVTEATLEQMKKGVWLADPDTGPFKASTSAVKITRRMPERTVLEVTIKEGRNRQVRRVLAKLGHKVRELIRTQMGPLELGTLKVGAFRPLSERELSKLRIAVEHATAKAAAKPAKPKKHKPRSPQSRRPRPPGDGPRRTIIGLDEQ